jgi:hypothetical protein
MHYWLFLFLPLSLSLSLSLFVHFGELGPSGYLEYLKEFLFLPYGQEQASQLLDEYRGM